MSKNKPIIICLGTYPPRECGIATFSKDLVTAYNNLFLPEIEMRVVAMQAPDAKIKYPKNVLFTIDQDNQQSYKLAARKLNKNKKVSLVNIQHEFGIFGGNWGEYLELFLAEIKKPVVITMHTVLPNPDSVVLDRVNALVSHAQGVIVMTKDSKQILINDYQIPEQKINVIPHGIHPLRYSSSSRAKTKLGLPTGFILSTFGLLSPNKGIEYIISALPEVIKKFPSVTYLVLGKTHPTVKRFHGEVYRQALESLVTQLKLSDHVKFVDRYFEISNLLEYLQATDLYISGSLDPNQAVSGTFSYALGTGRPIISTAFAQAKEDLTADVGSLVGFRDSKGMATAIIRLLEDDQRRTQMGKNAYLKTRHMTWPNVGLAYAKYFSKFAPVLAKGYKNLPPIKLSHLIELTDDFGIFQFAHLHMPDPNYGYTLDDNARALIVMVWHYKKFKQKFTLPLIRTYLNFIEKASIGDGNFHNYFTTDRKVDFTSDTKDSLEDANARCMLALMTVSSTKALPKDIRAHAKKLSEPAFSRVFKLPRPAAFYIKGLYLLRKSPEAKKAIIKHCDFLVENYKQSSNPNWEWFERQLTYSNALLPEALLLGFAATGKKQYFEIGKKTLDFLIKQTFVDGMYMAIGQSGWYEQGGQKALFDQQPEDPAAMVQALKAMYLISGQKKYYELMHTAFNWFLGDNALGQFVYDTITGGSYDGISPQKTNLNQGAESSISYLLARLSL